MKKAIIVDIDNTIALDKNIVDIPSIIDRKNWNRFHQLKKFYKLSGFKPIREVIDMISYLYVHSKGKTHVIFLTAREDTFNGKIRLNSYRIIRKYFKIFNSPQNYGKDYTLLMRKENDFRPSAEVKEEFLLKEILPNYEVLLAFDDEEENIKMYQKHNITTLKVNVGGTNEK